MTPFLLGERVYLRGLEYEDRHGDYENWFNDAEICAGNSHHVYPLTDEQAWKYIQHVKNTKDDFVLAITTTDGDKHIGNVALQNIHPVYRSADFAIIIGEKDYWGQGYGKEAAMLMFDHGFKAMNLHRIACATFSNNFHMMQLALFLYMKLEGERRQGAFKDGDYVDIVEYGILREEWLNR